MLASEHHIHRSSVQTLLGGQCGNRALGDYLQLRTGPQGEAHIAYVDSNNIIGAAVGHAIRAPERRHHVVCGNFAREHSRPHAVQCRL